MKEPNDKNSNERKYTEFKDGQEYTVTERIKEDGFKIISHHPVFTPEEQERRSIEATILLYNLMIKHDNEENKKED